MTKKNDKVSDFEWQSAAAFFRYVAIEAELIEYSLTSVYSFQVTKKTGLRGLVVRKSALLRVLTENLKRIEKWAQGQGDALGTHQLVFVRSLYQTTGDLAVMVKEQTKRAEILVKHAQDSNGGFAATKETKDELPF